MWSRNKNETKIFQHKNTSRYSESLLAGILGMLGLIVVYVLIIYAATRDVNHAIEQFVTFKYWIVTLILGFGIQAGLFWYIKSGMHLADSHSKTALATGAGASTVSMVACCAHHLTDVLPILGFIAITPFLSKYQTYFFLIGIISNIGGIALMIYIIKTKKCPSFLKFKRKQT